MEQTHFPTKAVIGDEAIYLVIPTLQPVLGPVMQRLEAGTPVEAHTDWRFGRSRATGTVVILQVTWDSGERSNVGFAEQHWSLLPEAAKRNVIGLTYELTDAGEVPGVVPLDAQSEKLGDILEQLRTIW